jgi:hypothetical protein
MGARMSGANRFVRILTAAGAVLGVMAAIPASADPGAAERAEAERLVDQALALLPTVRSQSWNRTTVALFFLRTGRCDDALGIIGESWEDQGHEYERLTEAAHRAGLAECTALLARRWAGSARRPGSGAMAWFQVHKAGAWLRVSGHDAEGRALIDEAEAALRQDPLTRTSRLWFQRWSALRIYESGILFDTELERTVREFLASPPSSEAMLTPSLAAYFAAYLHEKGDDRGAKAIAEAICSSRIEEVWRCGANSSDAETARRERRLAEGGSRGLEFGRLTSMANRSGEPSEALAAARAAMALEVGRREVELAYSEGMWHHLHSQLAQAFAAAGTPSDLTLLLRRARPGPNEKDRYQLHIAAGNARRGDEAAMRGAIAQIRDTGTRREAWWNIAIATAGIPVQRRFEAIEQARGTIVPPSAPSIAISPPVGTIHCQEMGGGWLVASEGASAAAIIRMAEISGELAPASATCAYRRYLLDAVRGTGGDERARAIALELFRTTERPCADQACDDSRVLRLLLDLGLYEEAGRLVTMFDPEERIGPLLALAAQLLKPVNTGSAGGAVEADGL